MIPDLDNRDGEAILKKIKELAPYYVPEWTFDRDNMEPGTVLSVIFSEMMKDTIKRYNQILYKNRTAFLNVLNAAVFPAKPSRAYVTFLLSTGTKQPVLIPKGTKVSAQNEGEINFETEMEMLATPALPVCAFQTGKNAEYINELKNDVFYIDDLKKGFILFEQSAKDKNMQEHSIYIGDPVLFNIKASANIYLKFENTKKRYREKELYKVLSDKSKVSWEYITQNIEGEEEAVPFDEVVCAGDSLALFKKSACDISKTKINGVVSNFIRCKLNLYDENEIKDMVSDSNKVSQFELEFDSVFARVQFWDLELDGGIEPDKLFVNDMELNITDFYPFGEFFNVYDCFYLSANEVLSKKGANIEIGFNMELEQKTMGEPQKKPLSHKNIINKKDLEEPEPLKAYIESVIWEYWNGTGWARLSLEKEYAKVFEGALQKENSIIFKCPMDISEVTVNGHFDYYIRIRIVKIWNAYQPNSIYMVPKIKKILLKYDYNEDKIPVKSIMTFNNMNWEMAEDILDQKNKRLVPFEKIQNQYPALYLGFDIPPECGPIHLYFSLNKLDDNQILFQPVWEYYGSNGWRALKVIDNTFKFSSSGSVIFAGPSDFIKKEFFGKTKYWIRVYNRTLDSKPSNVEIDGIFMNTTKVMQQESIRDEIPEIITEGLNVECHLAHYPVFSEEIFINEVSSLTETEMKNMMDKNCDQVKYEKDEYGNIKEFWIKWSRVNDFLKSGADSRHYIADCSTGRIVFNGKRYGKLFFKSHGQKIKVNYKVGGGTKGNVEAYAINNLKNSIAFVESVINHRASFGGCEIENMEEAVDRETNSIKHRNRAVTAEDIEALAMLSSRNIARVKCISNLNGKLEKQTGCFTVVIFPKGGTFRDDFFTGLKDEVKKYILEKTSVLVAFVDRITVMAPVFVEYSVEAQVVVEEMEGLLEVEKELLTKLNDYLNPQTGKMNKQGWAIGEYPHISNFYTILKSVKKVKFIENLVVKAYEIKFGNKIQIEFEKCRQMPYMMIENGQHQINVSVLTEGY